MSEPFPAPCASLLSKVTLSLDDITYANEGQYLCLGIRGTANVNRRTYKH